jgi:hypothetical protein
VRLQLAQSGGGGAVLRRYGTRRACSLASEGPCTSVAARSRPHTCLVGGEVLALAHLFLTKGSDRCRLLCVLLCTAVCFVQNLSFHSQNTLAGLQVGALGTLGTLLQPYGVEHLAGPAVGAAGAAPAAGAWRYMVTVSGQ